MTTNKELQAQIDILEAENKALKADQDTGRIWPDVSKACKNGEVEQSTMVLRGVNANPKNTVNMYPAQFARMLKQLPDIIEKILEPKLFNKFKARTEEERNATRVFLTAYLAELRGGRQ